MNLRLHHLNTKAIDQRRTHPSSKSLKGRNTKFSFDLQNSGNEVWVRPAPEPPGAEKNCKKKNKKKTPTVTLTTKREQQFYYSSSCSFYRKWGSFLPGQQQQQSEPSESLMMVLNFSSQRLTCQPSVGQPNSEIKNEIIWDHPLALSAILRFRVFNMWKWGVHYWPNDPRMNGWSTLIEEEDHSGLGSTMVEWWRSHNSGLFL